ncbi:bifunctional riboflavin kinase/FAD synthetase [Bacillus horti]|uniref:Riboflavin biosynthesis protein n=1 Tax=Caldalkalibacillus horti TaxID=77523 RepID=A0ABT9VUP7_9BACI|nr:bifunctional riboflavin kinase/FAD synthetase [Bacillus horti]MDQ0164712.1 riboflavin kinase/FMN adenylyltransferase [Bacillus horti]
MEIARITNSQLIKDTSQRLPSSVAFGNFDGIHIGHQQVIQQAIRVAKELKVESGVMTFYPHPLEVLTKVEHPSYLTPLEDKLALFKDLGVDVVFVVDFTLDLAKLSPQEFIQRYIVDLQIKHVVTGFDFSFGHKGSGRVEHLEKWGLENKAFTVDVLSSVDQDHMKISSSRVRSALHDGRVGEVSELLNRYYKVKGTVIHGEKRGRTIGFPTANLELTQAYVLPRQGVYAVYVTIQGIRRQAVCNIGKKPTFHNKGQVSLEVHILDFEGHLYDSVVDVEFVAFLRSEQKFNGIDELVNQIHLDIKETKKYL